MADELDGFEQLFHQYLLDRKASASTVTWDNIESLPEAAVSGEGGGGRRGKGRGGECRNAGMLESVMLVRARCFSWSHDSRLL